DFGIGIRVFSGFNSVYAYTNDASREGLLKAARTAAKAIKSKDNGETTIIPLMKSTIQTINPIQIMPNKVEKTRKLAVMRKADEIARNYDPEISQVIIRLKDEEQNVLVANSEGTFAEDKRVYSRMAIMSVASDGSEDRKSTRLNSSHVSISYAVFC